MDSYSRLLARLRTEVQDDQTLQTLLIAHGCDAWVHKLAPDSKANVANLLVIQERIRQAAPFLNAIRKIPYALIKGPILSQRIYSSPALRRSSDLDFLLLRKDVDEAKYALLENGFIQGKVAGQKIIPFTRRELIFQASQSHQVAPFIKATGNPLCPFVNIDLNTSIFWGESGRICDMDFVLSETESSTLFNVSFKRLAPEMEFLSLCLHHYKDMNSIYLLSVNGLRLGLFCEIFDYLRNVALDEDKLFAHSERLHATPYIYYCLYYTDLIFDTAMLKPLINKFHTAEGTALLACFGLNDAERHIWKTDFWERLLSPEFSKTFYASLTEREREKVQINHSLM